MSNKKALAKAPDSVMPVAYQEALKGLQECQSLNDATDFADAAEALAVWARIYKVDEVGREARQLKLHAYRRMGQLAHQLAPIRSAGKGGRLPGPAALLRSHGLTRHQADAAIVLAKQNGHEFETVVEQQRPPAPTTVARRYRQPDSTTPLKLLKEAQRTPFACGGYILRNDPGRIAELIKGDDRHAAEKLTSDLIRWLQRFNRALHG